MEVRMSLISGDNSEALNILEEKSPDSGRETGDFTRPQSPDSEYDAWFRARYEEGIAAYEVGDVCSHEEIRRDMAERRQKYLAGLTK